MSKEKHLLLFENWRECFDGLPDEMSGRLIKHLFEYHFDGNTDINDPILKAIFSMFKFGIDGNKQDSENKRKAGIAGAKKRWQKDNDVIAENSKDIAEDSKAKLTIPITKTITKTITLENRKNDFMQSLSEYVDVYGKDMLREFYDYWTEHKPNGKKMRFEMQKTWDTSKRLERWSNNSFGKKSKSNIENILTDLMNE